METLLVILWTVFGFFFGSIPFSLLLGRLALSTDVRGFGDGNPGAMNAWRAGGFRIGLAAGVLDFLKGAVPVGLAHYFFGIEGWGMVFVAMAPVLGSAFSPFLHFKGGKSIAVTFGVWTGLLMFEGPLVLGILFGFFSLIQTEDSWSTILGMSGFLVYLLLREADPQLIVVWAGNMSVLIWKHKTELRKGMELRPFLQRTLRRAH